MFKIGEFSKLTQVSIRMLRYYDENDLLKPAQTDPLTGYRLYSADQIADLNRILFLRDTGSSVTEIRQALNNWDGDAIYQLLLNKQREAEATVALEQSRLKKIQQALTDIPQETIQLHANITIKQLPSFEVISLRRVISDYFAEGLLWKELSIFTHEHGIPTTPVTFSIYHDEDFRDSQVDVEVCDAVTDFAYWQRCFPSLPPGLSFRRTEAVEHMACSMVLGPFENIGPAFYAFAAWLEHHNEYEMAGPTRQIVHRGQWNAENPEDYLTEIQIELRRKAPSKTK